MLEKRTVRSQLSDVRRLIQHLDGGLNDRGLTRLFNFTCSLVDSGLGIDLAR